MEGQEIVPSAEQALAPPRRTFSQLHQDVWSLITKNPLLFIVLPVVLWLPVDIAIEGAAREMGGTWWRQFQTFQRLESIALILLGTLVWAIQLSYLVSYAAGQPTTSGALRAGLLGWWPMIKTAWSGGWRIGLASLVLLVPGIVLLVRYVVALPITILEGTSGYPACAASSRYVKGRAWRIFFIGAGWYAIYLPFTMAFGLLTPTGASPVLMAVIFAPVNILLSLQLVVQALLYVDLRDGPNPPRPLGRVDETEPWAPALSRLSARFGVLLAVVLSVGLLAGGFIVSALVTEDLIENADEAWIAEDFEESLRLFERAAYWNGEDAYIQYSIALCHWMLDRKEKAESFAAIAVRLEPENFDYRLFWVRSLLSLDRDGEARNQAERLSEQGFEYPGGVDELLRQLDDELSDEDLPAHEA